MDITVRFFLCLRFTIACIFFLGYYGLKIIWPNHRTSFVSVWIEVFWSLWLIEWLTTHFGLFWFYWAVLNVGLQIKWLRDCGYLYLDSTHFAKVDTGRGKWVYSELHWWFDTFVLNVNFFGICNECAERRTIFSYDLETRSKTWCTDLVIIENSVIFSFDTSWRVFPGQLLSAWPTRGREENRTKLTWVATKNTHPKKEGGEKEVGAEGRGWTERYHTSERRRRLEKAGGREQEIERERAKEGVKTSEREKGE